MQQAVARYLDACPGALWCHVPNEAKRGPKLAAMLKSQGLKAGVPDVLIFTPPPALPGPSVSRVILITF